MSQEIFSVYLMAYGNVPGLYLSFLQALTLVSYDRRRSGTSLLPLCAPYTLPPRPDKVLTDIDAVFTFLPF